MKTKQSKPHTQRERESEALHQQPLETFFSRITLERQQTLFVNRENSRHYQYNILSKYSIFLVILLIVWINGTPRTRSHPQRIQKEKTTRKMTIKSLTRSHIKPPISSIYIYRHWFELCVCIVHLSLHSLFYFLVKPTQSTIYF